MYSKFSLLTNAILSLLSSLYQIWLGENLVKATLIGSWSMSFCWGFIVLMAYQPLWVIYAKAILVEEK